MIGDIQQLDSAVDTENTVDAESSSSTDMDITNPQTMKAACVCCSNTANPIYKCPKCYLKYCSVKCCQLHKTDGSCPGKPPQTVINQLPNDKRSSTAAPDSQLDAAYEKLKELIQSPNLQEWIRKLDSSNTREASQLYDAAMENPEFLEFSQLIAKIRSNDSSDESEYEL